MHSNKISRAGFAKGIADGLLRELNALISKLLQNILLVDGFASIG
jgi:hypothetical protein